MITELGERDKRVCRASRVICCNDPVLSIFLALIQHYQNNMPGKIVKLAAPNNRISCYHSMTAAPQVSPAPKTTIKIKSPRWTRPDATASSKAMATEAAEGFPYLWRLTKSCSGLAPRRSTTASMMRRLAWCGMMHSISNQFLGRSDQNLKLYVVDLNAV